jgi:hypothetical protein
MVMSTPAGRSRCLRCRKLLGWQERLADTPLAPPAAPATNAATDEVSQLALLRSIVSTLATAAVASPLPRQLRPPHHARFTTTISVLLSRPQTRRLTTTD